MILNSMIIKVGQVLLLPLPPNHIKFSKSEQLQIYNEMLNQLKVKQEVKLFIDLIFDSQVYLEKNYML